MLLEGTWLLSHPQIPGAGLCQGSPSLALLLWDSPALPGDPQLHTQGPSWDMGPVQLGVCAARGPWGQAEFWVSPLSPVFWCLLLRLLQSASPLDCALTQRVQWVIDGV